MSVFSDMYELGHEQVVFCRNEASGLNAIIAIHDTTLGPALGGCRLYDYPTVEDALKDALRLSRAMSYKAAVAGVDYGGGQAVIIGDPSAKNETLFRAFGRHVDSLGGRYITAEDMNTNVEDMNQIGRETRFVTGSSVKPGGSSDPSPVTGWGIYQGIRACLEVVYGTPEVKGRRVVIQGLGNVGWAVALHLHQHGANLVFADINRNRVRKALEAFGGEAVEAEDWYTTQADVLAPCAVGGVINPTSIPLLRAPIVAGGANNILEDEDRDGEALIKKGITYAPDYVINAGGLISVAGELRGTPREKVMNDAMNIFDTVKRVLNKSAMESITPVDAANRLARERMETLAAIHRTYIAPNAARG